MSAWGRQIARPLRRLTRLAQTPGTRVCVCTVFCSLFRSAGCRYTPSCARHSVGATAYVGLVSIGDGPHLSFPHALILDWSLTSGCLATTTCTRELYTTGRCGSASFGTGDTAGRARVHLGSWAFSLFLQQQSYSRRTYQLDS